MANAARIRLLQAHLAPERPKQIQAKAYVLEEPGAPFILKDVVLDTVRDDEVLVEMRYTGLCHTDLVAQGGDLPLGCYPAVLGHEGVGIVKKVGKGVETKSLNPGDTVILSFNYCNKCRQCRQGRKGVCVLAGLLNFVTSRPGEDMKPPFSLPDGTPVFGQFFGQSSMSSLAIVAQRSVVKIDGARLEDLAVLAPMACGYLSGAGTVFNVLEPSPSDTVAVIGTGAVGFAAIMAAKVCGAKAIVALDIVQEKLDLARELGATHTINTSGVTNVEGELRDIFRAGVDRIIDTTGMPHLLNEAFRALANDGMLAVVGVPSPTAEVSFNAGDLLTANKRVVGVIEGHADPNKLIPYMYQLYNEGKFPVDKICKIYPAEKLDLALTELKAGEVIKPILSWSK